MRPSRPRRNPTCAKLTPKPEPSFFDDLFGGTPAWVIGGGALAALAGIAALIAARRRKTVKFEDSIIGGTDIKTNTVFGSTGGGVVNTGENSLADRFQPRGSRQHRHRRSRSDRRGRGLSRLRTRRAGRGNPEGRAARRIRSARRSTSSCSRSTRSTTSRRRSRRSPPSSIRCRKGKGEVWQKAVDARAPTRSQQPDVRRRRGRGSGRGGGRGRGLALGAGVAARRRRSVAPPRRRDVAGDRQGDGRRARSTSASTRTSRSRGPRKTTNAQIEKIDAAEREFEESAKRPAGDGTERAAARPSAPRRSPRPRRPPRRDSAPANPRRRRRPAISSFHLDDGEKPAPMGKRRQLGAGSGQRLAGARAAAGGDRPRQARSLVRSASTRRSRTRRRRCVDGQWHDAATKLDLAKAYQEMGDVEGAREILQEVLHEGDDNAEGRSAGAAREARLNT